MDNKKLWLIFGFVLLIIIVVIVVFWMSSSQSGGIAGKASGTKVDYCAALETISKRVNTPKQQSLCASRMKSAVEEKGLFPELKGKAPYLSDGRLKLFSCKAVYYGIPVMEYNGKYYYGVVGGDGLSASSDWQVLCGFVPKDKPGSTALAQIKNCFAAIQQQLTQNPLFLPECGSAGSGSPLAGGTPPRPLTPPPPPILNPLSTCLDITLLPYSLTDVPNSELYRNEVCGSVKCTFAVGKPGDATDDVCFGKKTQQCPVVSIYQFDGQIYQAGRQALCQSVVGCVYTKGATAAQDSCLPQSVVGWSTGALKGDVDCSSDVTVVDQLKVKYYLQTKGSFTKSNGEVCESGEAAADVNCDGSITDKDVGLIKDFTLGKISSFTKENGEVCS